MVKNSINNSIKRRLETWQKKLGYVILNYDGWRKQRVPISQLISLEEFHALSIESTIVIINRERINYF